MPIEQTRAAIQRELGIQRLEDVFEWIDLEEPLGSASIAQVCVYVSLLVLNPLSQ